MQLLAVCLLLAASGAVKATDPVLWKTWHDGAARVAAPVTEYYIDGEKLRNDTITAFDTYINTLEVDIERQYAYGVNDILQPCGLRFREIVDLHIYVVEPGYATADEFDYQLWYLAISYDRIVELARFGQQARRAVEKAQAQPQKLRKVSRAVGSPRYTLDQLFYDFESSVVERDFGKLRDWLLETFDAGYAAVREEAALMEENLRQKYLWSTAVESLQRDSHTVSRYDVTLEQYSTPIYWQNYVRARADLWDL